MNCLACGKLVKEGNKVCSRSCAAKQSKKLRKRHRLTNGYREIYHPSHDRKNKYIREHLLVMSKHIGRNVKYPENVHHIDGDKLNNDILNLFLCKNVSEHTVIHKSMEQLVWQLLKTGLVTFNRESKKYEAVARLWLALNKVTNYSPLTSPTSPSTSMTSPSFSASGMSN